MPHPSADETLQPLTISHGPWLQLFSPRRFEWNVYELPMADLPAPLVGLRIVHLTDIHLRAKWLAPYDQLIDRLRDDPPDLILLSGDVVEHKFNHTSALPFVERFLRGLTSRHGTWVTLGNHDGDLLGPQVTRFGAHLINGRCARLTINDAAIELVGVPGVKRGDAYDGLLEKIPPREAGVPRIALAHYPDSIWQLRETVRPDIVVAGHTHGGQVCLPGGIPILRHTPLAARYAKGVHRFGDTWLVVGRGLGFATYEIRVFCPSEVIEIKLQRQS